MFICDCHCDTLTELYKKGTSLYDNDQHFDIKRQIELGGGLQFCAIFVPTHEFRYYGGLRYTLCLLDKYKQELKALQEKGKKNLTIITNSIEIIIELFDVQDWTILSTGGASREGSFALVGPQTDRMLSSYHVDKAIISCKGIDISAGVTDSDDLHANNKRTMLSAAKEKILAVDSSKFDRIAFTEIGTLEDLTAVITDEKPEDKWLQVFKDSGVRCIYPE